MSGLLTRALQNIGIQGQQHIQNRTAREEQERRRLLEEEERTAQRRRDLVAEALAGIEEGPDGSLSVRPKPPAPVAPPTATAERGGVRVQDIPLERLNDILSQLPEPVTEPDTVNWQTEVGEDGYLYQIHPQTGQARRVEGMRPRPPGVASQPSPPNWQVLPTDQGLFERNPQTGQTRPIQLPGASGSAARAPSTASRGQNPQAIGSAMSALDNYEAIVKEYMGQSPVSRAMANTGFGGDQAAVGRVEAAQRALLLEMKTLAELGALAGPDVDIVTGMIGDPTSWGATLRDPSFTLSKLAEARRYLEEKAGVAPRPAGPAATAPTPATAPARSFDDVMRDYGLEPPR